MDNKRIEEVTEIELEELTMRLAYVNSVIKDFPSVALTAALYERAITLNAQIRALRDALHETLTLKAVATDLDDDQ